MKVPPGFIDVDELVELLDSSIEAICEGIHAKQIPGVVRYGTQIIFEVEEIMKNVPA